MTILTAAPDDPTGYGRIVRRSPNSPEVEAIVEQKALTAEQQNICARSTPAFTPSRPRRCWLIWTSSTPTTPTRK